MEPAGFPERLVFVRNGIELFQAEDAATLAASRDMLSSVSPASHSPNILVPFQCVWMQLKLDPFPDSIVC